MNGPSLFWCRRENSEFAQDIDHRPPDACLRLHLRYVRLHQANWAAEPFSCFVCTLAAAAGRAVGCRPPSRLLEARPAVCAAAFFRHAFRHVMNCRSDRDADQASSQPQGRGPKGPSRLRLVSPEAMDRASAAAVTAAPAGGYRSSTDGRSSPGAPPRGAPRTAASPPACAPDTGAAARRGSEGERRSASGPFSVTTPMPISARCAQNLPPIHTPHRSRFWTFPPHPSQGRSPPPSASTIAAEVGSRTFERSN